MSLTMSLQSFCSTPSTSTPTPNPSASPAPSSTLFLIHSNATSTNLSHHTHVIIIEKDDDQERINEMKAVFKTIQIGLSFIAIHFGLEQLPNDSYERTFYSTYFETTIINTFLVASCYCALMLTLERYILITHPHMRRPANPKRTARLRIVLLLLFTFILHSPMSAQNRIKFINGRWRKMLLFRRESASLMRSFTEKKLTALMFSITFIFLIGNLPQIFVMVLQNEAIEGNFSFQLLRNIANALEVLNHCLNFYVFCMASSEYTRAFLLNCFFASRFLSMIPACARFIYTTKPSR
ncbi:unnamed protein product [Anisakis simplex]|uniref:G_PROTEIN_RECEP_F1_2 domain-containing protein n=1 Tax=Anisakis simplex TaxID=6269 RepID=A0A0M3K0A6_ANISI|nr:unnamed protein product [Anisakis simplex]